MKEWEDISAKSAKYGVIVGAIVVIVGSIVLTLIG